MTSNEGFWAFIGCFLIIALIFAFAAVGAFVFMIVWNIFVPAVFGGPEISYVVAFAGWLLLGIIGSTFRSG